MKISIKYPNSTGTLNNVPKNRWYLYKNNSRVELYYPTNEGFIYIDGDKDFGFSKWTEGSYYQVIPYNGIIEINCQE